MSDQDSSLSDDCYKALNDKLKEGNNLTEELTVRYLFKGRK